MKKLTNTLLVLFFATNIFAKKVDIETALFAAKNLYYIKINQIKNVEFSNIELTLAYEEFVNNKPVYFIFNVNTNDGFVIISADDIAKPCIGYNFEGSFSANDLPPSFKYYINTVRDEIVQSVSQKAIQTTEIAQEWNKILTNTPVVTKSKSIQPLLLTTWKDTWPYNEQCPYDAAGPGSHVHAGCIAVSMAQVMKYYNYPNNGAGSNSYTPFGGYGTLSVNYAAQTYIWENMPNSISSTNSEIAKLIYHCGVSVNMGYAPDGSGANMSSAVSALETYFRYNTACQLVSKTSYTHTDWESLLKAQLDNNRPIIYCGVDISFSGWAWNCDGYIGSDFHFNWGWGGIADGYYAISGTITAAGYNFNSGFSAVIDIYPNANYPEGCTSTAKLISGESGTFNDGSGNTNYLDNTNCQYLIQTGCASTINLFFDRFNLSNGDFVYVYNGASTSDPLLGTYSSGNLPTSTITSTNSGMLIRFVSDGSGNAEGWYASYNAPVDLIPGTPGPINGTSNFCQESISYTYSISPVTNATSYVWTLPGGATGTSTTNTIVVTYGMSSVSGNITVKGINSCGEGPISTLAITINIPPAISNEPVDTNICEGLNTTFGLTSAGTNLSYQWQVNNGAGWYNITAAGSNPIYANWTSSILSVNSVSFSNNNYQYRCVVSNIGCTAVTSNTATLVVKPRPNPNIGSDQVICNGTQIILDAGTGYTEYHWNDNSNGQTLTTGTNGNYSVTVTGINGCTNSSNTVNIQNTTIPNPDQICIVTVDTLTWKNKVLWEKTPGVGTDGYKILKEVSTSIYDSIGYVNYNDPGYFIDITSNPESHSDRYKISVIDTCGNESDSSYYHNTINLVVSVFGSTMGLVWTHYQTEDGSYTPSNYYIYKGTTPQTMQPLTMVTGNQNTYNDVGVFDLYYYMVGVQRNCNTGFAYSNYKSNGLVNRDGLDINSNICISPNPANDILHIDIAEIATLEIINTHGQILKTDLLTEKVNILDISNLRSGVYTLRIKTDRGIAIRKLIKQ